MPTGLYQFLWTWVGQANVGQRVEMGEEVWKGLILSGEYETGS